MKMGEGRQFQSSFLVFDKKGRFILNEWVYDINIYDEKIILMG